jgi:hypothetical protein
VASAAPLVPRAQRPGGTWDSLKSSLSEMQDSINSLRICQAINLRQEEQYFHEYDQPNTAQSLFAGSSQTPFASQLVTMDDDSHLKSQVNNLEEAVGQMKNAVGVISGKLALEGNEVEED